jgi:SAM-dependent methyltransferase
MTSSEVSTWINQLASVLPLRGRAGLRTVLDLGSGTGRFSPALAEECSASVIGVEPSADMRAVAIAKNPHPRVEYRAGRAEELPIEERTCDAAFLFLSLHHFDDLDAAFSELARVCKPASPIVIRTEFRDRPHLVYWHGLLPDAAVIDRDLYPPMSVLRRAAAAAGIDVSVIRLVPYLAAVSLGDYIRRLRLLSISALRLYGEDATNEALSRVVLAGPELDQPVWEVGHLVVCRTGH